MRSFSKKLAFVLAAAMVVTGFAPAAQAKAADEMAINKSSQILYLNEGINHKGAEGVPAGKGNVSVYDFSVKNKPSDWKTAYSFAWSSSNEDVVTVKAGGVTTAVGVGKATVYCKVTEKATKKVTTLKTAVEVKENAAKVAIKNADKWDGTTVEVNGVVDLDRVMYNAAGKSTTKRGTLVTDYTRWVAEPSKGVEINQTNGKFTFTEEAEAGDYTLYCETYQSSKYTKTTATSDKVVVTFVGADAFEVKQTASNGFNLLFNKAADVKIADVTVNKIITVGNSTGKLPMVVSGVTMSEDKKTASVSLFSNFENGVSYEISVKGYDEVATLVASIGKPTTMTITSTSNMQGGVLVYTNTLTDLTYTLFDEFGNDITNTATGYVVYTVANATSADYYVSGNSIFIYKEGTEVAVNAEYYTGEIGTDGYQKTVKATGYFVGVNKAADTIASVSLAINRWGSVGYTNNRIPVNDNDLRLTLKIKTTVKDDSENTYLADSYIRLLETASSAAPQIRLRSSNPDILDVSLDLDEVKDENGNPKLDENGNKMYQRVDRIVLFKEGTAAILVDLVTKNADGTDNVNTIAATYVTVLPKRSVATITADGVVTVGTGTAYNTAKMNVTAKDQYGDARNLTSLAYAKIVDSNADVTGAFTLQERGTDNDWNNCKLVVNGTTLMQLSGKDFAAGKNEITLYVVAKLVANEYTVDYKEQEVRFSVIVKKPAGAESLAVEVGGTSSGNVGRYVTPYDNSTSTEDLKTVEFKVFKMQNGVKVVQRPVAQKLSNTVSGGAVDDLYYTVTHDGADVTAYTYFDENTVKLDYSDSEEKYMVMPSGYGMKYSSVKYKTADDSKNLGAGTYVFTLYKVVADSTGKRLSYAYVSSASATVSCDVGGSYSLVKRTSETATHTSNGVTYTYDANAMYGLYNTDNQKALRDCFEINDRGGNKVAIDAKTPYFVDAIDTAYYVHVKSITFYECVDTKNNVYAPYTVNINVSLKK